MSSKTLILDRSSQQTLIAFDGDTLVLDGRDDQWVTHLQTLLNGRQPEALAVGLGPGSFAGIRAAIACLQGLGIAWSLQPVGFPSAALYAVASGREFVTVVGDARRNTLWVVDYHVTKDAVTQTSPFRLCHRATFQPTEQMVSPDAKRLAEFQLLEVQLTPALLESTFSRLTTPPTQDPLPIYLHPAVGVARAEG